MQNDLILVGILDTIFDTVSTLLKGTVEKRSMLDSLELVLLTIDESVRYYNDSTSTNCCFNCGAVFHDDLYHADGFIRLIMVISWS